jgi:hypothetical protein
MVTQTTVLRQNIMAEMAVESIDSVQKRAVYYMIESRQ